MRTSPPTSPNQSKPAALGSKVLEGLPMFFTGQRIGSYRLIESIGRGSVGEVWRARAEDPTLEAREVALTLLRPEVHQDALFHKIQPWPRPDAPPHLVPLLDFGLSNGTPFLACALRPERSLAHWLEQHGGRAPSAEVALDMVRGILKGLQTLHASPCDIVHGNLHLHNILLHDHLPQLSPSDVALPRSQALLRGSRLYRSPEALTGKIDRASDLWAVGVIFYQLVTGTLPFPTEADIGNPRRAMAPLPDRVPAWIRAMLARALHKDVHQRFANPTQFLAALEVTEADPLESYRRLALEYCGSLDLFERLQEDGRGTDQELRLLSLYVPLKVRVEKPEGVRPRTAAIDTPLPQASLEERRRVDQLRAAGRPPDDSQEFVLPAFIGDRLAKSRRLVVLGDPGTGKTTLVKWIATAYLLHLHTDPRTSNRPDVQALPNTGWLPIMVRCRDLNAIELGGSLDELLNRALRLSEMTPRHAAVLPAMLARMLSDNQAILLIDGLDEITDLAARRRFCRQLGVILRELPRAHVLVTSRIVGYQQMGLRVFEPFEHLIVSELDRADKERFVRQWCDLTESPERRDLVAQELLRAVHDNDRLTHLTGNPMLLTTLALVQRHQSRLPGNRACLLEGLTDVLLRWRGEADEPLDKPEAQPQAEYLAYAMCQRGVQQLRADEVLGSLEDLRRDYPGLRAIHRHSPAEFLGLLVERTAILDQVGEVTHLGKGVAVYEFRHLALQEYLASLALLHGCYPGHQRGLSLVAKVRELLETPAVQLGLDAWREPLRLCVASCRHEQAEEVIRAILGAGEPRPNQQRVLLAASCLAEDPEIGDEAANEVLLRLVGAIGPEDGLGRATPSQFDRIILGLACSEFWELLRNLLARCFRGRSHRSRERFGLLLGLGECARAAAPGDGSEDWLDARLRDLDADDDRMALHTCLTLVGMGHLDRVNFRPGVVASLLSLIQREDVLAHAAAWALRCLRRRDLGRVRRWYPEAEHLPPLLAVLQSPRADRGAQGQVAMLLGRARFPQAIPDLILALGCKDGVVVRAAANALVRFGEDAIDPLLDHIEDDSLDEHLRGNAIAVFEHLPSTRVYLVLERLCKLPDPRLRSRALAVLMRKEGTRFVEQELMSERLDGATPFRDPGEPIPWAEVERAARVLNLSIQEARRRFQALADRYHLRLGW